MIKIPTDKIKKLREVVARAENPANLHTKQQQQKTKA